ncbi:MULTISPECIES: pertussis toxin binding subunit S2 [Bordetella]|uniref:Pertussis toxin subunit 2 n=1 Tax=Bordetella genomosp. 6 TaxID=463024 RepID=A0ABX4FFD3_9BORD|nr:MULTISPECIES: pertussis toxin binding subunit S2 [Bordetella]AOB28959.1 Pertussis toxin subunit 2 [Bordetella bronchiseptica]AZW46316.1 Pertussis toxin subunit 2 [Bordetella bronchiseptica]KCV59126.1 pertussis toxin subunit 2 [Bordetella bronchiseptica 99-R-0433]OZI80197.1 Pertussis toxin subunit 2 [Bordetella genomosp. 6]
MPISRKTLCHFLSVLPLACLGFHVARASTPGIVIPPQEQITFHGGPYGRCANKTRALTVAELRGSGDLQEYLRHVTRGWSIFALYDGTYLGGEYGGVIKDGTPGGAFNLKSTFCIMTTRNTGQPATDHYYSNVTATRLLSSTNSRLCAVFVRSGQPVIGACTSPYDGKYWSMYSRLRKMLYLIYVAGISVRVHVSKEEQYYDYEDATFETYALTGISICNPGSSLC